MKKSAATPRSMHTGAKPNQTTRRSRQPTAATSKARGGSRIERSKTKARRAARHGPEAFTVFSVTPQDISGLDSKRAVELVADLLWAEARRLGAPTTAVHVSTRINVADGGVDARVDELPVPTGSFLSSGQIAFQIKTGDTFKPWQKASLRKELFGNGAISKASLAESVRECLKAGGLYILICTGTDPVDSEARRAKAHLKGFFKKCGFPKARYEVWGQNHLIGLLQRFPSLALKVTGNAQLDFQTHATWGGQVEMRRPFTSGTAQQQFLESTRAELRRADAAVHVRVRGEAGIGKTRLALEATRAPDLCPLVIYCDGPLKLLQGGLMSVLLREDTPVNAIVVVDECDFSSQTRIWNQLQLHGSRIKFVSIYNDSEESAGTTVVQDALPLDAGQITEIIARYGVPEDHARRWAELCDGSPRVAHVVGLNLKQNPDDILKQPDTVDLWNRYIAGNDPPGSNAVSERRTVLEYIALFKRFGFEGALATEAQAIAALVQQDDPGITWPQFRRIVQDLRKRKILQGAVTLYITPRLLHIKLWADWWDTHGGDVGRVRQLLQTLPPQLAEWSREMFRYARESEAALRVTRGLLDEHGPYGGFDLFEDGRAVRFFRALTDAAPEAALRALQRAIGDWELERLKQLTGDSRRYVVWSLEAIAVWRELFADAARLLLALGEAENEGISNNASGVFAELFSAGHGAVAPTEASMEERFPVLKEALESPSALRRRLGLRAAEEALNTGFFSRMVGSEYQGLRRPPELWTPKTWGEVFDGYRRVWRLLMGRLEQVDATERSEVVEVLANASRGLLQIANLFDMVVDSLREIANTYPDSRSKVVEAVELSLHYDGKGLPGKNRIKLESVRTELVDSSFHSQLERYVGMDPVQDHFDKDGNYVEDKFGSTITRLAKEAIADPGLLDTELPWLLTAAAKNAYRFGHELGSLDSGHSLLPALLAAQKAPGADNAFFLSGYLSVLFARDQPAWESALEDMAHDPRLSAFVPEVTWRSGMTERAAVRIVELIDAGVIQPVVLRMFAYGGVIRTVPEHVFVQWIDKLLKANDRMSASIALDLFHFFYVFRQPDRRLPRELSLAVLINEALFRADAEARRAQNDDYDWAQIATPFLKQYPEEGIRVARAIVEHLGEDGSITDSYNNQVVQTLTSIAQTSPSEVWDLVAALLGPPIDSRAFRLKTWLREGGISAMRREDVWHWVDADVENRAWYVASFVPPHLVSGSTPSWAREVLVRYGKRKDVRSNLHANFGTESWSGPASAHYDAKKRGLESLREEETEPNVRRWLDEAIDSLERRIEQERIWEERQF